jgi:glycolate oxidase iron-sulfur subunit
MSSRILDAKIDAIARSEPDVVCTGNPGCLLQLRAGVEARGLSIRVAHPIELLDEAYGAVAASSDQR